jgi:hypothetical protein
VTDDSLQGDIVGSVVHVVADAVERLETLAGEAVGPLGRCAVVARHKEGKSKSRSQMTL